MQTLILTLHLIVCFLLVILILLQSGKEGMGVIFGGGNSSVFGSTGAGGILAKLTTLMAIIFVITSLSYTYVTSSKPETESVILNVQIEDRPAPKPDATAPAGASQVKPEQAAPDATGAKPDITPQADPKPANEPGQPADSGSQPAGKSPAPAPSPAAD